MRKEIQDFAEQMERVMAAQDITKGDSWKKMEPEELVGLLRQKQNGGKAGYGFGDEPNDYVDAANYCMMIWHRAWVKKQFSPSKGEGEGK